MREWIKELLSIERDELYMWETILDKKLSGPEVYRELQEWLRKCHGLTYGEFDNITYYDGKYGFKKDFVKIFMEDGADVILVLLPSGWIKGHIGTQNYTKWLQKHKRLSNRDEFIIEGKSAGILMAV